MVLRRGPCGSWSAQIEPTCASADSYESVALFILFSCALLYFYFDLSCSCKDGAVASPLELLLLRRLVRTTPRRARSCWCRGHVSQERVDAMAIFSMSISKRLKRAPARFRRFRKLSASAASACCAVRSGGEQRARAGAHQRAKTGPGDACVPSAALAESRARRRAGARAAGGRPRLFFPRRFALTLLTRAAPHVQIGVAPSPSSPGQNECILTVLTLQITQQFALPPAAELDRARRRTAPTSPALPRASRRPRGPQI